MKVLWNLMKFFRLFFPSKYDFIGCFSVCSFSIVQETYLKAKKEELECVWNNEIFYEKIQSNWTMYVYFKETANSY